MSFHITNFENGFRKKSSELKEIADRLRYLHLNFDYIEFNTEQLTKNPEESKITPFPYLIEGIAPVVYYFSLGISNARLDEVQKTFLAYKNKKNARKCAKVDLRRFNDTDCLYVGSVQKDLCKRFDEHLGYGSPSTYSLQLLWWAKELNLNILFHFAYLDKQDLRLLPFVEDAIASELKPVFGK